MPIMDGFETVKKLKKLMKNGEIRKGICIAVTGFVDLNTKIKCFEFGMDFYLSKPVKIKDLQAFIDKTFIF
jgi:CheY-like chemotaxis protein